MAAALLSTEQTLSQKVQWLLINLPKVQYYFGIAYQATVKNV